MDQPLGFQTGILLSKAQMNPLGNGHLSNPDFINILHWNNVMRLHLKTQNLDLA